MPKIQFYKDIPNNSSILNISKDQTIISCSKFPYDEMLYQYINQYLSVKRISSAFYSELFNLIVKILYYKYAPLDSIKNDFINMTEAAELEFELSKEKMEYIDIIYSRLNDSKYNFDTEKFDKDMIKKYQLEGGIMASDLYDYIIDLIKNNKNEKILNNLKSFLFDKKSEFIKLFNYLNSNAISISYPHFEEFYYGIKNMSDYMKANYLCVFISPILDLLDTKVNIKDKGFTFFAYPQLNSSLLLYTNNNIKVKETNGILTKYFSISNENLFFQHNYAFEEYKKYNFNKYIYTKPIEILFDKKLLDGKQKKKLSVCQMLQICRGLIPNDKNSYKMSNLISSSALNEHLITFGRLLFIDEERLNDNDQKKFNLILRSFSYGSKISDDNEFLSRLFYLEQLSKGTTHYKELFADVIKKEKDIKEKKEDNDLFKLIEMNFRCVLNNYNFLLDSMEVILNREILDIIS
jgi:predicted metal-dependent hydrolase